MNRRDFLQYSTASLLLSGCSVQYSPYEVNTDAPQRNVSAIEKIKERPLPDDGYSIALISDSHNFYDDLDRVINHINSAREPFAFGIHGGDMTDDGLQREFDMYHKTRKHSSLEFVHAIGNHDALTNGIEVFRNAYGAYDYRFQTGKLHVIVFNNNTWEFGDKPVNLDWLEKELEAAYAITATQGGHILVVNHINHNSDERFSVEQIARYRAMMKTYNVSLSINGHNHEYDLIEIDGMKYLTIGSVQNKAYIRLSFTGPARDDFTIEKVNV